MRKRKQTSALIGYLDIDPKTGEIITPLKWDAKTKRYSPSSKAALSVWELHLIEGSARLRAWAIEYAQRRKGHQ